MPDKENGAEPAKKPEKPKTPPRPPRTARAISYIKRKLDARRAKYDAQTPEEKAAWRTANATVWIAIFTVILGLVGGFTLYEVIEGGNDTHDLAVAAITQAQGIETTAEAAKTQAIAAIGQAEAAKISADAARSAAETAIATLHVSERAYLEFGAPQWSLEKKTIDIRIENDGRIPSGKVEVVTHEATVDVPNVSTPSNLAAATEKHWQRTRFQRIVPNVPMSIKIPIVKMDSDRLKTGLQLVMVVGFISYNDGFDNSPPARELFCIQSVYSTVLKEVLLSPCDPTEYLPKMELVDGYPNNEQRDLL